MAVLAPNLAVKPHTVLFNKVTIKNARQATQLFGPAQYGIAKAVADSVANGLIPLNKAEDIFIAVGVFIHWDATDDAKIQEFNYQATKQALERAIRRDPSIEKVLSSRFTAQHPFAA